MSESGTRRVLVAVEPVVLEGAFAVILERIALDEVVQYHSATPTQRGERYDAAIVSTEHPNDVAADVVITLPDTHEPVDRPEDHRRGHVTTPIISDDVDIRDQRAVIDLLDEYAPLALSRSDRLAERS